MNNISSITDSSPIKHVLVVDDEESIRVLLARALSRAGFSYREAQSAEEALELMKAEEFDLVISDIVMPGMDGVELLRKIKKDFPQTDVMIMTGYGSEYSYMDIMKAGASDYVTKPFRLGAVLGRISRVAKEKKNLLDLQKTNQELCAAIERSNILAREADEASKAKTFFLASMSHEIRTPLNGIVGYTDMLMDTPLDEEQRSFLKNAKFSCDALLAVVNDILDFSKVEAGKLVLGNIGFDPEVLCFDAIDVIRSKVDESRVELLVSVADSVPGTIMGDPHRFRQVLLNLLSNAAKFTKQGEIQIAIDSKEVGPEFCELTFSVKDSGIGIAENELEKIFQPFAQSQDDITAKYGGTGLGLVISKNIAKKMGGDIWVESQIDNGSTFYFSSVLKIGENKKVNRVRPAQLKGKRALLCTVSDLAYEILAKELELCGTSVSHVDLNGLSPFLKKSQNRKFDIGIIDFGNSSKSDIKKIIDNDDQIRQKAGFDFIACSIPVSGISGIFKNASFKGFLPKPVLRRKMFEMIAYVMGIKTSNAEKKEDEIVTVHLLNENKKHAASILLVEDNPVNQKMTKLMLTKAGYMIDVASNGLEAVERYKSSPEAFDLIFMDINMPVMNGFEATRLIRSHEKENPSIGRIPILALTANVLDDFKEECKKAQMDDFLTKPIKRDVVFQAIRKWVAYKTP